MNVTEQLLQQLVDNSDKQLKNTLHVMAVAEASHILNINMNLFTLNHYRSMAKTTEDADYWNSCLEQQVDALSHMGLETKVVESGVTAIDKA